MRGIDQQGKTKKESILSCTINQLNKTSMLTGQKGKNVSVAN